MKKILSRYKLEISGAIIGALAGWCYWYFVGCASGQCLITSKPLNSTLYGMLMGATAFSLLTTGKHMSKQENQQQ
ncbi:hypothetical protein CJD36_009450 [Flavipsychrobacter stenotrophus]|uniref:YtxH domain-containing protein n=1 Tax=Flavipsychrobacter stenotrophus TaxID=2077091 RepID=A0A2S7SZ58_9BACT|nr:hypothetical protein [Flavipsychrobacter stenotrophus]PQJ12004.1 hypothetical protein CJD36_009450 [Flavipsychrobacter stenotrophus]